MSRPKILIVDDEPFNVDYLEQELEDSDCETISAANGQEALARVQADAPDLVLLDIMLPVMDGFEVLARLKADAATRDVPVIVISAGRDLQSVVRGIQLGAEDYLPKPFEPVLLHARISSSLEKKRLRDLQQLYLKGLERELEIGREIQQGFLPAELPHAAGWEVAALFKAACEVAGDFYDAFLLPDDSLVGVIGDVCGKGVGAALFMTLFRSLIRVTATTDAFGSAHALAPAERLRHVVSFTNRYIVENHGDANLFATLFIGVFDAQDGTLTYANCGNEPPLLLADGRILTSLRPTGPVVGVLDELDFQVREIALEAGSTLLAFTDGIPDALDVEGNCFGAQRLERLLAGLDLPPAALLARIEEGVSRFAGAAHQFDDITLLAVKRIG